MRGAHAALAAILLCAAAAHAGDARTLFLVHGPNAQRALEDRLRSELEATGKLRLVDGPDGALLVGRFTVDPAGDGWALGLAVTSKHGALLLRAKEKLAQGQKADAALKRLAAKAAALDPEPGPFVAEVPADAPAAAKPAARNAPEHDWREPFDPDAKWLDIIGGVDALFGPWSANASSIAAGSSTFDLTHYAPVFASGVDGRVAPGFSLHGGVMFLGQGAFEMYWDSPRGATLFGGRLAWYPFAALWPARPFDLGVDLGYGYSLVAANGYTMTGTHLALGVTGEYPINRWLGAIAYYRLYMPSMKHFYVDYANNLSESTSGVTLVWHSFGVGLAFHPAFRL